MAALFSRSGRMPAADGDLVVAILRDVHPLQGGRVVWVVGHWAVVQLVEGQRERRYRFELDPAELRGLTRVVSEHDFLHLTIAGDMGKPDEARPDIYVRLGSGQERSAAKGRDEYCPGFDLLYERLLQIAQRAIRSKTEFDGPYDFKWVPKELK